jgi:hypothetical protein
MTKIGAHSIQHLRSKYAGLAKRADGIKKKGEETVGHLVSAAEVSATAFAFGALQGRQGPIEVVGIPVDLGTGALLHLAGFFGLAGGASEHLHSFADGALASYFFTLGRGVGINMKSKTAVGTPAVKGDLTDAELRQMAAGQ